jgi:hypothetical protein
MCAWEGPELFPKSQPANKFMIGGTKSSRLSQRQWTSGAGETVNGVLSVLLTSGKEQQ